MEEQVVEAEWTRAKRHRIAQVAWAMMSNDQKFQVLHKYYTRRIGSYADAERLAHRFLEHPKAHLPSRLFTILNEHIDSKG